MAPSHAEIWDDSALVDSWNEALEEYKKYHSIAAKGEKAEDVLARDTDEESKNNDEMTAAGVETNHATKSTAPTVEISSEEFGNGKQSEQPAMFQQKPTSDSQAQAQISDGRQPALPQHLIGQVHDEGLKNLLMSWYYAGYYTGLYEGQQSKTG